MKHSLLFLTIPFLLFSNEESSPEASQMEDLSIHTPAIIEKKPIIASPTKSWSTPPSSYEELLQKQKEVLTIFYQTVDIRKNGVTVTVPLGSAF